MYEKFAHEALMSTTFQLLNSLGGMMGGVVMRDENSDALQVCLRGRASEREESEERGEALDL